MPTKRRRKRGFRRSDPSPENPANPIHLDSDEAYEAFGASRSASGVRVTPRKALGYPAVWRAVSLIAGDVGKLPLQVCKLSGKNKEPSPEHPAYRLVRRKPNALMTAFTFKQTLQGHALCHGNGYAYIDREAGVPVQLLILDPNAVEPVIVSGRLWYLYTTRGGEVRKLPAEDILHIKGLGFDGIQGYPVVQLLRESIGAAIAARDHSAKYFRNGARPGGVLEHPKTLSDPARTRIRNDWNSIHQGLDNAHKVAILEEGATYKGFSADARNAQLLETREFDAREVANIFGVPTHKLGDPSKVAYNSLGEENQSYYDDTLSNWLVMWSQEGHDKLLTEEEKRAESHTVDFDYQEIQRANLPAQVEFASKLFEKGFINQDEGRAVFGYNPIPDGKGQRYFISSVLVPADAPPPAEEPGPTPEPAPRAAKAGLRAVLIDVAGRMARRLATHREKAARSDLAHWLEFGILEHSGVISDAFGPALNLCRDLGHPVPELPGVVGQFQARFVAAGTDSTPDADKFATDFAYFLLPE